MGLVLHIPLLSSMDDIAMHSYDGALGSSLRNFTSGGPFGRYCQLGTSSSKGQEAYRSTFNTKDISISFWMKPTYNGVQWADVMSFRTETDDLSTAAQFRFEWTGDGYAWFNNGFITGDGGFGGINASDGFTSGAFHHLVLTASIRGKTVYLKEYIDGVLKREDTTTQAHSKYLHFIGPFILGDMDITTERLLSDVRVYDHVLSHADVHEMQKRLMVHYIFDDHSYGHLKDVSGFGLNATVTNCTIQTSGANIGASMGSFNAASNNYIALPTQVKLPGPMSYSIWARMENWSEYATGDMRILSCTDSGGFNIEPSSTNLSDGRIRFAVYDASKGGYNNILTNVLCKDLSSGWHMFTFTFDGMTAKAYIDGGLCKNTDGKDAEVTFIGNSIGYNGDATSGNTLFLGAEASNNATSPHTENFFTGKISDFRLYATALTEKDISDLYSCRAVVFNHSDSMSTHRLVESNVETPYLTQSGNFTADNFVENAYLITNDGCKFLRIFMHDLTYFTTCFPTINDAKDYIGGNLFSRLKDLEGSTFKTSSGHYEFILRYDKKSSLQNRWKQKICPFDYNSSTANSSVGYYALDIKMKSMWGGSTNGTASTTEYCGLGVDSSGSSLLDCRPHVTNWHGGLGQTAPYNGGMPAPDNGVYKLVELFVRVDNTPFDAEASITQNAVYMNEFREE